MFSHPQAVIKEWIFYTKSIMKKLITKSWNSVLWLREFLRDAPDGKYVIASWKETRHNLQNALYWALLNFAEEQTGTTADVYHEYFKRTHWQKARRKRIACMGKVFYSREEITTTTMKKDEFAKYLEKCEMDLVTLGVYLPPRWWAEWDNFLLTYS